MSSTCELFKLAFEGIYRWSTKNHISCAHMVAMAVCPDETAVCIDDSDNFTLTFLTYYSTVSKFHGNFKVCRGA